MIEPIHSFAILAYGHSPFLGECLHSIEMQTGKSLVYIATSTPSPELSKIAGRYKVPVLVNPKHKSIADDWSFAYRQCSTKYLTLAHQDDIYLPYYSASCVAEMERYPKNLIAFTDYFELFNDRLTVWNINILIKKAILMSSFPISQSLNLRWRKRLMLSWGCAIPCPTVMYNKNNIGDFSFSSDYQVNLDWDAWERLTKFAGGFTYLPKRLVAHRIHSGSQTARGISDNHRLMEDERMFKRFWPLPVAILLRSLYRLSLMRQQAIS